MIQEKALILNSKLSCSDDFKVSMGWLKKLRICHGISQLNIKGGGKMSENVTAIDSFVTKIEKLMKDENLTPDQNYICNESRLYWKALLEKNLSCGK